MTDNYTDKFYLDFFIQDSGWNQPYPNRDEITRAEKILSFMTYIIQIRKQEQNPDLRIVDVGCGRGWLTSFLGCFGTIVGIEPVDKVTAYAKTLFPDIPFFTATPDCFAKMPEFLPFDVLICSEVIEHVKYNEQRQFILDLISLLKPDGFLILTTPRGELFSEWRKRAKRTQPIENWLTEEDITFLLIDCGLTVVKHERCYPTNLFLHPFRLLHKRPFCNIMSLLGYSVDNRSGMMYQVILAKK